MGGKHGKHASHHLHDLQERTKYTQAELIELFKENNFDKSKGLSRKEMESFLCKLFEVESIDPLVFSRLFEMFDTNKNNRIEFEEFAVGMSIICRGSEEERAEFMFRVIDLDGNGSISKSEFTKIADALRSNPATQKLFNMRITRAESVRSFVNGFFGKADADGNGIISLDEYTSEAKRELQLLMAEELAKYKNEGATLASTEEYPDPFAQRIVILGPPLSGKHTLANLLSEHYGAQIISVKALIDEEIKSDSELGQKTRTILELENVVPDVYLCKIIQEAISKLTKKGWIFIDFPITKEQIQLLNSAGVVPDKIFVIESPQGDLADRAKSLKVSDSKFDAKLRHFNDNIKVVSKMYDSILKLDGSKPPEEIYKSALAEITRVDKLAWERGSYDDRKSFVQKN